VLLESPTLSFATLLAQAAPEGADGPWVGLLRMAPFVLIFVLFYVMFILPQQNKQKRFKSLIDGLKTNDHVVTTGGLHGVITNVNRETGRATLRIDEATGAKVQVNLWAIEGLAGDEDDAKKGAASKD